MIFFTFEQTCLVWDLVAFFARRCHWYTLKWKRVKKLKQNQVWASRCNISFIYLILDINIFDISVIKVKDFFTWFHMWARIQRLSICKSYSKISKLFPGYTNLNQFMPSNGSFLHPVNCRTKDLEISNVYDSSRIILIERNAISFLKYSYD